jgi:hypothetical protein
VSAGTPSGETRVAHGSWTVAAGGISDAADRLNRAVRRLQDVAVKSEPSQPGAEFDVECAGLVSLALGAYGSLGARLRATASRLERADDNFWAVDEASIEALRAAWPSGEAR